MKSYRKRRCDHGFEKNVVLHSLRAEENSPTHAHHHPPTTHRLHTHRLLLVCVMVEEAMIKNIFSKIERVTLMMKVVKI
jgi:hypothetical protein